MKYIFDSKDKLIEELLISIEEIPADVSSEELYYIVDILFVYYSAVNKDITEADIVRKIKELEGKGENIMTILQAREKRGIEKGIEIGLEKGMEKGMEKGRMETKINTAKKLLGLGLPFDQIAEATDLPLQEIHKLNKKMDN